ncbi:PepSY domain-containing protein [Ectobacillus sp. sgz5001026]|uniref:PepSY domain-containing protein n=1 Tax=Ectobacillus sp. sgz5001026 TaxID=3242473 RepID=UPI0036D37463
MNWKNILLGVGLGFTAGYFVANQLQQNGHISADKALKMAKKVFSEKGEITGSWIHMVPEVWEKYDIAYDVYRGGVTTVTLDKQNRYEFLLDANTGTILDVTES